MHLKRTTSCARTERRRSHATEGSPFRVFFCLSDDGHETAVEEIEVPQILVQARPALPHPGYCAVREELNAAQKARGFFGPRRGAGGRGQGPCMKRSSIEQLKLRTRCARCRKLGRWARECPEGNRGQLKVRSTCREIRGQLKRVHRCGRAHGTKTFLLGATWTFVALDPGEVLWDAGAQEGLVGEQQMKQWTKLLAKYGLQVDWSQKNQNPQALSEVRRSRSVLYVCQSVWPGATASSASLSWSRMFHHSCRWE